MVALLEDPRIDWSFLRKYSFDEARFRRCAESIARGTLTEASSIIAKERLSAVPEAEVTSVAASSKQEEQATLTGHEALRRGTVAVVVLNGGMATRFGGVVKGVVEVFDGQTFISLKAEDICRARARFGASIPFVLMNSFATDEATRAHVRSRGGLGLPAEDVLFFEQSISLRLRLDGSLFIGRDGRPSYHAPGHGDFFTCIRASGILSKLRARGVRTILFSNVDNLGATVDPTLIGHHILSGKAMNAEVTEKQRTASGAWDKGGAPCRVDGMSQLVEGFRFPSDFQQEQLPDFSTNNFMFDLEAIDRELELERHGVRKTVDGEPALQLESITCEASGIVGSNGEPLLSVGFFRVPREGATGRFFPVKEPQDLEALRSTIARRLEDGWKRRDG